MRHPFRRKNFRLRLVPLYLTTGLTLALADPTTLGFALGGAVVGAGLAVRTWAAGYLVKTARLTVAGPYAYLRHPLYAGTLLLAVGFGVISGPAGLWILLCAFLPTFFFYYLPYKDRVESDRLEACYGAPYVAYCRAVPALLPRRRPWCPPGGFPAEWTGRWRGARYRENDELGTLVGVTAGLCLLALRAGLSP